MLLLPSPPLSSNSGLMASYIRRRFNRLFFSSDNSFIGIVLGRTKGIFQQLFFIFDVQMRPAPGSTHPSFRSRRGRSRSQQGEGRARRGRSRSQQGAARAKRGVTATPITGRRTVGMQLLKIERSLAEPDPDADAWILSSLMIQNTLKRPSLLFKCGRKPVSNTNR